jgi:hypothetical protein
MKNRFDRVILQKRFMHHFLFINFHDSNRLNKIVIEGSESRILFCLDI